jgi:hypothetical protein
MDHRTRRRLRGLIKEESDKAASRLLEGKDASQHLGRLEAAQKAIGSVPPTLMPGWWLAMILALASLIITAVLSTVRIGNTPVHLEAVAETVRIETTSGGFHWQAGDGARLRLRTMTGVALASLPGRVHRSDTCGIAIQNSKDDIRLVDLGLSGEATVTLLKDHSGELVADLEASTIDTSFSAEEEGAEIAVSSQGGPEEKVAVGGEFFYLSSSCGFASVSLFGSDSNSITFDLGQLNAKEFSFLRRSAGADGTEAYRSSLVAASVKYLDTDSMATTVGDGERLSVLHPRGWVTLTSEPRGLTLIFEGEVGKIARGGGNRSMNPSWLAFLMKNQRVLVLISAITAIWAFLWGARGLLMR